LGQDKHIEVQKHLLGTNPILIGELPSGWPKVHVDPYRGLKENDAIDAIQRAIKNLKSKKS